MIDRFDDGDPSNNDQGAGEYDPADHRKYSGGDLRGVTRRIDYIKGLGATAVWITPPVANQWFDERAGYGGYHGYWAENFMKVDAHYGTLADYQVLSHALHTAGMYLIQDVVVNHTGNFFGYDANWNPEDPTTGYSPNTASVPVTAPTQWPFSLNDPRRAEDREAAVYHWTPAVSDFGERRQELDFQLADLDDLNTENPLVRRALRESYGWWIGEVGVDAFRVDTAYHVPEAYFRDFMHADDPEFPGMAEAARRTGREDFLAFGEGFGADKPYDDRLTRKLDAYTRDADGRPLLPAMINFPLYGGLGDVFAHGRPTAELGYRLRTMLRVHADPHRMPSFVDNHDVDRFLASSSEDGLKQALLAIMTLPGIPTIYYGTGQGFTEPRRAMFASGYGSGGRDHFDTGAPLYRYLQSAIALRRGDTLFSRGVPAVLHENAAAAGAFAYRIDHEGRTALVVFNSADADTLLDNLDSGLPPGTRLRPVFAIDGEGEALVVGSDGRLTMRLPARAGYVWVADGRSEAPPPATTRLTLDPLPPSSFPRTREPSASNDGASKSPDARGSLPSNASIGGGHDADATTPVVTDALIASGSAMDVDRFVLVVDGDLAHAQTVMPGVDGRWSAPVDTAAMIDPNAVHGVVAWSADTGAISETRRFRVERDWTLLVEVEDPADDDSGPEGRYTYPADPSWGEAGHADIRRVRMEGAGGALRIEVEMNALSAMWNPANGFDHVAFTLFVEVPGRDGGATAMPLQNAELPDGMRWHYRLRAGGWSNALFGAEGAGTDHEGTPVAPSAGIEADRERRTVRFTLPAAALGRPETLSGALIYLTTWDYDGRYRPLIPEGAAYAFGGGDGARDPLVMDDLVVIQLP